MDDRQKGFIASATQDFEGDHERELAARELLLGQWQSCSAELLESGTQAMDKSSGRGRKLRWVFYVMVLLVSLPLIVKHVTMFYQGRGMLTEVMGGSYGGSGSTQLTRESLSKADRLLLFGDETQPDPSSQMKAL